MFVDEALLFAGIVEPRPLPAMDIGEPVACHVCGFTIWSGLVHAGTTECVKPSDVAHMPIIPAPILSER